MAEAAYPAVRKDAKQENLAYSVINEREISSKLAATLCKGLKF